MLLWWLCMTIAVTLGMVLMTAERLQADLNSQANHDPLTGALNRRAFSLLTEKATARSRPNKGVGDKSKSFSFVTDPFY